MDGAAGSDAGPGVPLRAGESGGAPAGREPPIADGWYACRTRPRAEKRVHLLLAERGIVSYLPAVPRVHQWRDRRRTVVTPLFAGYVFARCEPFARLVETPGVCDVVRFGGRPALVPDGDIRNIERFVRALTASGSEAPRAPFHEGERVRITGGPFAGVEGVVVRARTRHRVIVGLAAIGTGFELHVAARSLETIATAGPDGGPPATL